MNDEERSRQPGRVTPELRPTLRPIRARVWAPARASASPPSSALLARRVSRRRQVRSW